MLNHSKNDFVFLLLQKVDNSPSSKSTFATVCVISLVIIVHNFFGFIFGDLVEIYHLSFLEFVDFYELSEDLIFYHNFFGGSVLLFV